MVTIETERLRIRNFVADDWRGLQEVIVHYQASDSAKYEPAWPASPEEIQSITSWFATGDDYLCVCLKPNDAVIGFVAVEPRADREQRVHNLGYIFHPAYQGHGYALEGCRAVMAHLFEQLGAAAILTGTHPENEASIRLLLKLGLKQVSPSEYTLSYEDWQAQP